MAINLSIPGIVFKLKLFGGRGMGFAAAKVVGWICCAESCSARSLSVARRGVRCRRGSGGLAGHRDLSTLRSPFLPQGYGAFPAVWLLTLLAAQRSPTTEEHPAAGADAGLLQSLCAADWVDPKYLAVITVVPQMATIGVAFLRCGGRRPVAEAATELTPAAA